MRNYLSSIVLILLILAGCTPQAENRAMTITVVADGRERHFTYDQPVSVEQFLALETVGVTIGELDRVNPPENTQIRDGIVITVVRVQEQVDCEENDIPYQQRRVANEGLQAGEERLAQAGVNGTEQICYRTTLEDGQPVQRVEIRRVVLQAPQEEVVFFGVDTASLEVVPITGTLAYISNRNAWIMSGSSATKRPLTNSGALDGRVFELSPNGDQLLFTQSYTGEEDRDIYFNTLWTLLDTGASEPVPQQLTLFNNILYAEWVPGQPYTFSYSTAEARSSPPGWQAFNDLWMIRLDPRTAAPINPVNIVETSSGGIYGWWGTRFRWSPDGSALAWSRADSVGLVDLETGELRPLLSFPVYTTFQDWVWQPTVSWSPDGLMLTTTVHGQPFGSEQPETSPVFNVAVATVDGSFQVELVQQAGIWAAPQFSPFDPGGGENLRGFLAYLQARDPLNSVNGTYDLVVADRDGSNARRVFPPAGQAGLSPQQIEWSPDGQQVALIYQGNLWIVDVNSGRAQPLTVDGQASSPQWSS